MLKIRFQRKGKKKMPVFQLVVAEHTMPIQGRFIEKLGTFVSGRKKETLMLKTERIEHWLSVGAQPSQTVARLLVSEGMKACEKFIKQRKQVPSKAEMKKKEAAEKAKEEAEKAKEEAAQAEELKSSESAEAASEDVKEEGGQDNMEKESENKGEEKAEEK